VSVCDTLNQDISKTFKQKYTGPTGTMDKPTAVATEELNTLERAPYTLTKLGSQNYHHGLRKK